MAVSVPAKKVSSWSELTAAVRTARAELDVEKDEELWFRGVSRGSHELIPSLLRCFHAKDRSHDSIRALESDLFFEFLAKARTSASALDHWDVLFLMQHYRAPTRLLDWTELLAVALHFCVAYSEFDPNDCPRVYMLNPYRWNEEQGGRGRDLVWPRYFGYKKGYFYEYGELLVDNLIDWRKPVALYPPQRDPRLSAQRGYFTIHGTDPRPLDQFAPRLLRAIDLDESAVRDVKEQLSLCGIDEYSLFPDLEGLARQLKKRNGLP